MRKDLKGREPGCLDHQRPTSLEGTNCVSSLTYSSTISLHLSVCRLPGTLSPIYLPIPGAVLCLCFSLFSSFVVSSCLPCSLSFPPLTSPPHPTLLFHLFRLARKFSPYHIYERHCLLLVRRLVDLHSPAFPFFFSLAYFPN